MWLQTITLAAFITVAIMKLCKSERICVSESIRGKTYCLTKGVLALYLSDTFLLLVFNIPVTPLHEPGEVGIICSLFLIIVAVMNMLCSLSRETEDNENVGQQEKLLTVIFGTGVSVFWLILEVMGLLLKINP